MCHIGTWSTSYCMKTAGKVWRSKVKKNIVCRVSGRLALGKEALFPSVKLRHLQTEVGLFTTANSWSCFVNKIFEIGGLFLDMASHYNK